MDPLAHVKQPKSRSVAWPRQVLLIRPQHRATHGRPWRRSCAKGKNGTTWSEGTCGRSNWALAMAVISGVKKMHGLGNPPMRWQKSSITEVHLGSDVCPQMHQKTADSPGILHIALNQKNIYTSSSSVALRTNVVFKFKNGQNITDFPTPALPFQCPPISAHGPSTSGPPAPAKHLRGRPPPAHCGRLERSARGP